ncbi:MAG: hypothetical protein A3I00_05830 [Betaproteobacteria bacterium RIFCSPLOWO2_02_FULL_64_12]|nr:MAG: hypothetical protein A3I00_05830 [Betaproteobacteria bacterium RIFCSPLOWO2_02_FULL_64_12]
MTARELVEVLAERLGVPVEVEGNVLVAKCPACDAGSLFISPNGGRRIEVDTDHQCTAADVAKARGLTEDALLRLPTLREPVTGASTPAPRLDACTFFAALYTTSGGLVELRALPSKARTFLPANDAGGVAAFVDAHAAENVYFGVATRRSAANGTLANCERLPALFADVDFKTSPEDEARRTLAAFPLAPSAVIASGGGLHLYWFLAEPLDLATDATRARALLRRLASLLGGDLASAEAARVLRVPGTHNHKYAPARLVTVERLDAERRYDVADVEAALPAECSPASSSSASRATSGWLEMLRGAPEGERHAVAVRIAGHYLGAGWKKEEVEALLLGFAAQCSPAHDPNDVRRIVRDLTQADDAKNAARTSMVTKADADPWPTLAPEALHGLAGDIVRTIAPHTEADPVATLANVLVPFGNIIGACAHFKVEETKHACRLFSVLVGETAKGRKGTSWSTPKKMFSMIDPAWSVTGGLSSGEGLIYAVRDARTEVRPIKEGGRVTGHQDVTVDRGVCDKRLMLVEEELVQALKVMAREGNILSPTLRQAWDLGDLHPLTKQNPIKATGAHISIVAHITRDELVRYLTETEQGNGFANRFVWLLVKRSKIISRPTGIPRGELEALIARLRAAFEHARTVGKIGRSLDAEALWSNVYPKLSEGKPGLLGAVVARAEAQVMRLATVYALLDRARAIRPVHLQAALALWRYSEASARRIFGGRVGDAVADRILLLIRNRGEVTETDIHDLFHRHLSAGRITTALDLLQHQGLVRSESRGTGGRPETAWMLTVGGCEESEKTGKGESPADTLLSLSSLSSHHPRTPVISRTPVT